MVKKDELLGRLRGGGVLSRGDKLRLVLYLSVPGMLIQLSSIVMQYIDAMMVGQLGAAASASITLVSTTTWLLGGIMMSLCGGFAVLVAHAVGAKDMERARLVLRQSLIVCGVLSVAVALLGVAIHGQLPLWLGGRAEVVPLASTYFLIWALTQPALQYAGLSNGMLRVAGNVGAPFAIGLSMCVFDVIFNCLFIPLWGVAGAALATMAAAVVTCAGGQYWLLVRSELRLVGTDGRLRLDWATLHQSFKISLPMGVEHLVFCAAQIAGTLIVAPLGTVAIAANGFGIVVESLCYMPGYGIGDAATTLIGQSFGARRNDLVHSFSIVTVALGIAVMTALGVVMYVTAPALMRLMSPDHAVQMASVSALRIEAFVEPMYAASIVTYGVFVGLGDTLVPCVMNLCSIWLVRIPLAWWLSTRMGLNGVWIAMAIELTVRGIIFLTRLKLKSLWTLTSK